MAPLCVLGPIVPLFACFSNPEGWIKFVFWFLSYAARRYALVTNSPLLLLYSETFVEAYTLVEFPKLKLAFDKRSF